MHRNTTAVHSSRTLVPVLGLLAALGPLAFDMYLPALPTIQAELAITAAQAQLTLGAFLIGLATGTLIYGPLSDRYGRRPVLLSGLLLYVITCLACALSSALGELILLRFLNAVGGAAGMVLGRVIIRDCFPPRHTARLLSFMAMIMLVGPLVSPIIGGQLLVFTGWRSIFALLTGLGLVGLLLTVFILNESHPRDRRNPLNIRTTVKAYAAILSDRAGLGYTLCVGMASGVVFTFITSSAFIFIEIYGVAPDRFGYLYGLIVGGLVAGNYINTRVVMRVSVRRLIGLAHGLRLLTVGALLCLVAAGEGGPLAAMVALLVPAIGASALITPNITAGMLHRFPSVSGTASAVLGTGSFVTGALAGSIASALHDGTALPMAETMLAFACGSAGAYWFIAAPATDSDALS
ncbi:MAG: Bcr/CflA family multidrug efflux MFS transporter [Gammaproteobacteria bacterium]